jgi:hypothetical protein
MLLLLRRTMIWIFRGSCDALESPHCSLARPKSSKPRPIAAFCKAYGRDKAVTNSVTPSFLRSLCRRIQRIIDMRAVCPLLPLPSPWIRPHIHPDIRAFAAQLAPTGHADSMRGIRPSPDYDAWRRNPLTRCFSISRACAFDPAGVMLGEVCCSCPGQSSKRRG